MRANFEMFISAKPHQWYPHKTVMTEKKYVVYVYAHTCDIHTHTCDIQIDTCTYHFGILNKCWNETNEGFEAGT